MTVVAEDCVERIPDGVGDLRRDGVAVAGVTVGSRDARGVELVYGGAGGQAPIGCAEQLSEADDFGVERGDVARSVEGAGGRDEGLDALVVDGVLR